MIFTAKTIITWPEDPRPVTDGEWRTSIHIQRKNKLEELIVANKTDGTWVELSTGVFERPWIDEDSAREYAEFIVSSCQHIDGAPVPTYTISAV